MTNYVTTVHKMDGCVVRVHKPILRAEELSKREQEVKKALIRFYKETRK